MDIRPFTIDVLAEQLVDLRRRFVATKWPDQPDVIRPTVGSLR